MGMGRNIERKPFSTLLLESADVASGVLMVLSLKHLCCRGVFSWETAEKE